MYYARFVLHFLRYKILLYTGYYVLIDYKQLGT